MQNQQFVVDGPSSGGFAARHATTVSSGVGADADLERRIARERLDALEQMARGVAHDLNNTLSRILGYAELLLEYSETTGDQQRMIAQIIEGTVCSSDILKKLALFDRRSAGGPQQRVRFATIVRDSTEQLLAAVENAVAATNQDHQRIELTVDEDLLVCGNSDELRRLVVELVTNALEASPPDSRVRVVLERQSGAACLRVIDSGRGMSADFQARCVEPFQTTKRATGAGLGLSICHGIVCRHRGSLRIDSRLRQGTTAMVLLPAPDVTVA